MIRNRAVGMGLHSRSSSRLLAIGLVPAAISLAGFALAPGDSLFWAEFPRELRDAEQVVATREGTNENIAVTRNKPGSLSLWTSGHPMSSTSWYAQRYMRAMAHIPLLMMENPRRVLIICFGVGNTAHAASLHSTVSSIEVVDLSADVLRFSSLFSRFNGDVLKNPKVKAFVDDGRHHLLLAKDASYDLVTLEPPPITFAGMASLYSREFYSIVRERLRDGGFLTQWLPAYQVTPEISRSLVRSFVDVFPDCALFVGHKQELILMGRKGRPVRIDLKALAQSISERPAVESDLRATSLDSPVDIASTFVAGPATLARIGASAPAVTDDYPLNEYAGGTRFSTRIDPALFVPEDALRICRDCADDLATFADLTERIRLLGRLYTSPEYLEIRDSTSRDIYGYELHDLTANEIETISRSTALALTFAEPAALIGRSYLLWQEDRRAEALRLLDRAVRIRPTDPGIRSLTAEAFFLAGITQIAVVHARVAVRLHPHDGRVHLLNSRIFAGMGKDPEAAAHRSQAISLDQSLQDETGPLFWKPGGEHAAPLP